MSCHTWVYKPTTVRNALMSGVIPTSVQSMKEAVVAEFNAVKAWKDSDIHKFCNTLNTKFEDIKAQIESLQLPDLSTPEKVISKFCELHWMVVYEEHNGILYEEVQEYQDVFRYPDYDIEEPIDNIVAAWDLYTNPKRGCYASRNGSGPVHYGEDSYIDDCVYKDLQDIFHQGMILRFG